MRLRALVGYPGQVASWQETVTIETRRELVAWIDSLLLHHGFSGRARRQVDLVRWWQHEPRRIRIKDTAGRKIELQINPA